MDVFNPSKSLLIKLGSIAVHAEELGDMLKKGDPESLRAGLEYDKVTIQSLLTDPEVIEWRKEMDKRAFLPRKRN